MAAPPRAAILIVFRSFQRVVVQRNVSETLSKTASCNELLEFGPNPGAAYIRA